MARRRSRAHALSCARDLSASDSSPLSCVLRLTFKRPRGCSRAVTCNLDHVAPLGEPSDFDTRGAAKPCVVRLRASTRLRGPPRNICAAGVGSHPSYFQAIWMDRERRPLAAMEEKREEARGALKKTRERCAPPPNKHPPRLQEEPPP